ncbi:MAG: hypothetical protein RLZZ200_416 [Pseudomonadota bacterium]
MLVRHIELPLDLAALVELRDQLSLACADQSDDFTDALVLAAHEAATNVVRHAVPAGSAPTFDALLCRSTDAFRVELRYPGEVFTPPTDIDAPDFDTCREGGFGLFLMQQTVDTVDYDSPEPGTARITLIKRFSD